jgi:hypothetical protein
MAKIRRVETRLTARRPRELPHCQRPLGNHSPVGAFPSVMRAIRTALLLCPPLALAACAPHAAIIDLEDDKVLVEASGDDEALVVEEARRGCAIHGRIAVPLSSWCLDAVCSHAHYLFACRK